MQLSESAIKEFQTIWKEKYDKELSFDEATEQANRLYRYVSTIYDLSEKEYFRKERLKTEPQGFVLDGTGYTCAICKRNTEENENWCDKYGIKCTTCQEGINRKEIPASLAKYDHQWYSKLDLETRFNIKSPTVRKWVKEGILKSRCITKNSHTFFELFLVKDNKEFLPPKNLTESQVVSEERDGSTWVHVEPWYRFVDPFEHLKDYKIMNYLQWSESDNTQN